MAKVISDRITGSINFILLGFSVFSNCPTVRYQFNYWEEKMYILKINHHIQFIQLSYVISNFFQSVSWVIVQRQKFDHVLKVVYYSFEIVGETPGTLQNEVQNHAYSLQISLSQHFFSPSLCILILPNTLCFKL